LFNTSQSANPALANPALWEAARWSIDYELIADKLLRGDYLVHQSFLAAGFPGSLEATPYHLDIARARSILAKAGLGIGLKIKLTIFNQPPYGDIAQSLQATFAQAGIELDIEPAVASEVYSRVRARTEEAVWLYWIPDYFDANSTAAAFALNPEDGTTTLAWRAGWHIPQLSALTRLAARESDLEKRTTLYRQIQDEVQRASPFVIALQAKSVIAAGASVRGYFQGLDADMAYYDRVTR
jgi:peptide/nickel transport system substrate-binding protein